MDKSQFTLGAEESAKYYQKLLKAVTPFVKDLFKTLEHLDAEEYYSEIQRRKVTKQELKNIIYRLEAESYGHKSES
jgi:CCR4-NOT transcriptional regulation complex NOT5 subunit